VKRLPELATYERGAIDAILDEGFVCHLAVVRDGQPSVIPTLYSRVGDELLIHGSSASRSLVAASGGLPVCVAVTLVDGIVLARSVFESSINYRSVVVYGNATPIDDREEKMRALEAFTEQLVPGRWADARKPNEQELKATTVLRLSLEECSAKISEGPPDDGESEDAGLPIWAGVIPLQTRALDPVPDPLLRFDLPAPPYAEDYRRPARRPGD
jgi:nitroimidazol reductase NimA-like FMN-containing flavoprotein (pyridoxamine 5'-phosphate oxidase superfamily)